MPYKDQDQRREAARRAMQRVRNKQMGITEQGITKDDVIPDVLCDVIPAGVETYIILPGQTTKQGFPNSWMATEEGARKVLIAQNKMQIYYASQHGSY